MARIRIEERPHLGDRRKSSVSLNAILILGVESKASRLPSEIH
jgi:hypothetical protein